MISITRLVVLAAVFGSMAVEAWRAAANEAAQRARGGIEPTGDVYRIMRLAYPAAFLTMLAEGLGRGTPSLLGFTMGALLFALAKALKWWAIRALGPCWTFRVIVVPGMSLVATGPYRYLRHPNYVAVIGELMGVALMTRALVFGPIATAAFGLLILARVGIEQRALGNLGAILPPN